MRKLCLHLERLFRKFWFIIIPPFMISPVVGCALLFMTLIISLLFFDNIVDVDAVLENFTEEELEIVLSQEVDENVSDDEYLTLLARYQSLIFPKKNKREIIWTSTVVTHDAYIHNYELKGNETILFDVLREQIFAQIDKNCVHVKRLINSDRELIFRYTNRQTGETKDIVFSPDELRG